MGFRYRKSIKVMPGVKVNLSKSGVSASIGGKGHTLNVSSKGARVTTSIPGTGISHTTSSSNRKSPTHRASGKSGTAPSKGCLIVYIIILAIFVILGAAVIGTLMGGLINLYR